MVRACITSSRLCAKGEFRGVWCGKGDFREGDLASVKTNGTRI